MQEWMTCRFCGKTAHGDRMVKYGVRHYAHQHCYLDAGKSLADLHGWQVGQFSFALLKERGLADEARRLMNPELAGKFRARENT
jgi:hypothetical protein